MKESLNYTIKKLVDWLVRKRSTGLLIMRVGAGIIGLTAVGNLAGNVLYTDSARTVELSVLSSDTPVFLLYGGFLLGATLIATGLIWEGILYVRESRRLAKKQVIAIEQRGLVNTTDSPLFNYVEKKNKGKKIDRIVVDIRDRLLNGSVSSPQLAIQKFLHIGQSIEERTNQVSPEDVEIVYGGLVPVPFAFLTGYLLDDETHVEVLDWDRKLSGWRELDAVDDNDSFVIDSSPLYPTTKEVVLAVSFSYVVDKEGIEKAFPDIPKIYLQLTNQRFDNHWSKHKQDRLAYEFFEVIKSFLANDIEQVHLILACQNSVAFRFGQAYDKRNLPPITVYQYERKGTIRYPWGVHLSQSVLNQPCIFNMFEEELKTETT